MVVPYLSRPAAMGQTDVCPGKAVDGRPPCCLPEGTAGCVEAKRPVSPGNDPGVGRRLLGPGCGSPRRRIAPGRPPGTGGRSRAVRRGNRPGGRSTDGPGPGPPSRTLRSPRSPRAGSRGGGGGCRDPPGDRSAHTRVPPPPNTPRPRSRSCGRRSGSPPMRPPRAGSPGRASACGWTHRSSVSIGQGWSRAGTTRMLTVSAPVRQVRDRWRGRVGLDSLSP